MRQRLISVFFALLLLAAALAFFDTLFVNLVFAAVGGICIFEGLRAYKLNGNTLLLVTFELVHILNMFFEPDFATLSFVVLFSTFSLLVAKDGSNGRFSSGAASAALTLTVTMGFRAMLELRGMSPFKSDGMMLFVMGLAFGWICDTFALLVGRRWGKRKLSPVISPNKTVEGAVGGIVCTALFSAAALGLYVCFAPEGSALAGMTSLIYLPVFAAIGAVGAMCGTLGDLSMSLVKRDAGIKDFGNIMPGHGGALDRMDSALFSSMFAQVAFGVLLRGGV